MRHIRQYGQELLLVCTELLKKESTFILQLLVIFMLSASLIPTVRLALRTLEGAPQGATRTFWLDKGKILAQQPQAAQVQSLAVTAPVQIATATVPARAVTTPRTYRPAKRLEAVRVTYAGAQAKRPRKATQTLPSYSPPKQLAAQPAVKQADPLQQVRRTLKETYQVKQLKSYEESMRWARKTLQEYRQNT